MNNTTLYRTLIVSAAIGFLVVLVLYASLPGNPNPISSRVPYGIFMSGLPALGVLLVTKLSKALISRRGAVTMYLMLFVLLLVIQTFGRMIPVYH